jgi:hypothetical protein
MNKQAMASNPVSDIAGGTSDKIGKASELSCYSGLSCAKVGIKRAGCRSVRHIEPNNDLLGFETRQ